MPNSFRQYRSNPRSPQEVSTVASADRILQEAEKLGPVHVLVNNVGGNAGPGLFAESDPSTWQAHIDLSLMTMLRMTRAVLPGMIER
jgi:2-hydroxycyclohexanecarboxyl-CoA dehydrogenase